MNEIYRKYDVIATHMEDAISIPKSIDQGLRITAQPSAV